ncbi:EH domain-containing protein 1-like isoform X1 [Amphiura filiformis]|uniref:EH domain-containing protein 1-like isoform X1 n=1 Tax=Amphiura filiformis TaxID=82378 RepID=UPI003B2236F2
MFRNNSKKNANKVFESVAEGLKHVYNEVLLPLEERHLFHEFHSEKIDDAFFTAKPMILLIGQYSTGKTTFIKYLLESDFPGMRIGPEPTTDGFVVLMHADQETIVPGNALVVDPKRPFRPLSKFGNNFLTRFQCSMTNNSVVENLTIIDTPGILSGEKQRTERGYDFVEVMQWFAERVDRIILLFDAHKLDISDEFRKCIDVVRIHNDKIRVVLNKADGVDHQQLMKVYGALMWQLSRVLAPTDGINASPEVPRVYVGSFWNNPLQIDMCRKLFEAEQHDLFSDLQALPQRTAVRRLNEMIKRARLAIVHAYIISTLRRDMPSMFGKENKKMQLINNLHEVYREIERTYHISPGDFPPMGRMKEVLKDQDFSKFHALKPKMIEKVENMLANDMTNLMQMLPAEEAQSAPEKVVRGGAFAGTEQGPFAAGQGEGADYGAGELQEWVVEEHKTKYDKLFFELGPIDGKVSGATAKKQMVQSKLPNTVLGRIWKLSDVDRDGMLDQDEFALAQHLMQVKLDGHELPANLPPHLIPPSKRGFSS